AISIIAGRLRRMDKGPLDRALAVLTGPTFDGDLSEPYAAAIVRARRAAGRLDDPRPLLARWESVHTGSAVGDLRYRWPVNHEHVPVPAWAGSPPEWTPWRPAEKELAKDPL